MNPYKIIFNPVLTERTNFLKEKYNEYVFCVDINSNKQQIRTAVQKLFNVTVLNVRTSIQQGKLRKRGRNFGYRPDWKKAIVTIEKGQQIRIVEQSV